MNKKQEIAILKKQIADARTMKACGRQIIAQATLIESGNLKRLEELGIDSRRSPRGKDILSEETKMKLIGNLTRESESA